MPVHHVHSFCRNHEGFIRELRMMVTFLGFAFEPKFHGVYMEEFTGPCDVSVTIHASGEHLPFFTTALGGPTFDVACQRVALQALMELRMIYDDRLRDSSFRLVPMRTSGAHRSIYISFLSDRDPVMARHTRLLQAMDDLHTEAVLDAEEHHEAVKFLRHETKSLIQQNGELQGKIIQLQKDIAEMLPLIPKRKKPIREPAPHPRKITPPLAPAGPSNSSVAAPRPTIIPDPLIENFAEPSVPQDTHGSESTETASGNK